MGKMLLMFFKKPRPGPEVGENPMALVALREYVKTMALVGGEMMADRCDISPVGM